MSHDVTKITCAAAVVLLGLASSSTDAQTPDPFSGNTLYPHRQAFATDQASRAGFRTGVCVGMIHVVVEVGPSEPEHIKFCPPKESTLQQAVRIVVAYMDRNPGEMHLTLIILAFKALRQAWPCKE